MTAPGAVAAGSIAIEATDPQYFGLKHMPGGRPLDAAGKGVWPADQFTFRLIGEGALREPVAPQAPLAEIAEPAAEAAVPPRKSKPYPAKPGED
jgi:hypothetical protein